MKSEIFASFLLGAFCNVTFLPLHEYQCTPETLLLTHFAYQESLQYAIKYAVESVVKDWMIRSELKGVTFCWEAQNKNGDAIGISQNPVEAIPYFHVNYFPKTEPGSRLSAVGSQTVNEIVIDDASHIWIYMPDRDKTVLLNEHGIRLVEGYEVGKSINQFLSA